LLSRTPAALSLACYSRRFSLCSHAQSTGGDQANAIYLELERMGFKVFRAWLMLPLLCAMIAKKVK